MKMRGEETTQSAHPSADLDLPAELPELRDVLPAKAFIYLCVAAIVAALIWAAVSPITSVIAGKGKIVTANSVLRIEHADGGLVTSVNVIPGQKVRAGQVLVTFDTKTLRRQRETLVSRRDRIRAEAARVEYALRDPNTTDPPPERPAYAEMSREERLFWAEQDHLATQIALFTAEANGIRNQLEVIARKTASIEVERGLALKRRDRLQTLAERGLAPVGRAEEAERDLLRVEQVQLDLDAARQNAEDTLRRNEAKREELLSALFRDAAARQSELEDALGVIESDLVEIATRLERATAVSPVDGTVQSVPVAGIGDVVLQGELITEIVPASSPIQAEIEILADRIGDVSPGMPVVVKVATFDFAWYGAMDGEVTSISPTSFENQQSETVYTVFISFPEQEFKPQLSGRPLRSGMTVTAEIVGDTRTLLSYLLKPLLSVSDRAFSET